jgi:hypothetical protein
VGLVVEVGNAAVSAGIDVVAGARGEVVHAGRRNKSNAILMTRFIMSSFL